jgi:Icc-related predicted phosphoesterase
MNVRVAAVGDLHVGTDTAGRVAASMRGLGARADMLLIAGDLTRVGSDDEVECLIEELSVVDVPIVAVLGNHDHHAGQPEQVSERLCAAGIQVLEGQSTVITADGHRVGVAGIKGFGGGFAGCNASEFGELEMKRFVRHTVDAAGRLQRCLEQLDTEFRVALLHYSPIAETLVGEPVGIYPFLGSYLLAEAIDRAGADLVLHGHAHRGSDRGLTPGGVRVRNVAQPVLGAPYCVFELGGSLLST